MKKCGVKILRVIIFCFFVPENIFAQAGVAGDVKGLQAVLDNVYYQMLPLCSSLIGVGRGIAGFAALFYIAYRVWRHIANAQPVDFYPLFRPFVIGFSILIFPSVIALINGVMQPTVSATSALVQNSDQAITTLLQQKQQAIQNSDFWKMYVGPDGAGDQNKWYQYTHPDDPTGANQGFFDEIGNDIKFQMARMEYSLKNTIKEWMSEVLQVIYEAAALCINTIRTFYLIVLAILGPLVFGLSVFDGLHHSLTIWLARYINVFLWLPVANIFGGIIGKIQENMIALDINQIQAGGDTYFSSTDTAYLIFLIIGIIGYFTVPSVANYIVNAGGGNTLLYKVTNALHSTVRTAASTALRL
ncbi:MAG: conjugative transposon protein TraJ [Bacteroidetes bacterium]|nr:MAG: conjugative transposon protein TraJ [Bacteroidota bacterium]